jgi:hypothetical protein
MATTGLQLRSLVKDNNILELSLVEALSLDAIAVYGKQATGEKFLIKPQQ